MTHWLLVAGSAFFMVFFFGLCIFLHELGHFLVARWRGLHVDAFSIGFKRIFSWKRNGIEYRIGCIPFGGYVEIPQIDATGVPKAADGTPLPKAKPLDRMLAVFAGPFANILFGLFLGLFIWHFGIPQDSPKLRSFEVAEIEESSPEFAAGLRKGDEIVKVNGESFNGTWHDIVRKILFTVGEVSLDVRRGGQSLLIHYNPKVNRAVVPEEEIAYPFFKPRIPVVLYPERGGAAAKAGVKDGDEVLKLDGKPVTDLDSFDRAIALSKGAPMKLLVRRGGKEVELPELVPVPYDEKSGVFMIGVVFSGQEMPIKVSSVSQGSPAALAGILPGDEIASINGKPIASPADFSSGIVESQGRPVALLVKRAGAELPFSVSPSFVVFKHIGVQYAFIDYPNPFEQFANVCALSYKSLRGVIVGTANQLGLTEKQSTLRAKHFSGPIGIGKYLYISVYRGSFMMGLYIVVMVTFSLGLLNLLPLPVLDGGHITLAFLEMAFGVKPSQKVMQPLTIVFVSLLVSFMLFVTFYDIKRVMPWAFKSSPAPAAQAKPAKQGAAATEGAGAPAKAAQVKDEAASETPDKKN